MLGDLMYLENIREYVEDHKIIVTYKWLSRELNVPVNAAKQMLYAYAEQNPSALVTYMVSGMAVTSGQEEFQVHLVKKEELESLKGQLQDVIGVHVFSVQMVQLKDSGSLFAASYDVGIKNVHEYSRWSPIDSPYQQLNHSTASNTVIQAPVSAPAPPSTEEKNANIEARTVGQQSNTQSSDQKKTPKLNGQKKNSNIPSKKPQASQSKKAVDKKIAIKTRKPFFPPSNQDKVLIKEEVKEEPVTLESKTSNDSNGSLSIQSPEDSSPPPESSSPVKGRPVEETKEKAHDMLQFLDIDDGDSAEEPESKPAVAKIQVKKEKKTKRTKGRSKAGKESTASETVSKKRKRVQELSSDEETVSEMPERETVKQRKRMKKLVSKVHINEDGEMVTEKVWESDSVTDVSEEEDMNVDVSQSPAKAVPATDKASPIQQEKKKQSSLFKFLKK